MERKVNRWAVLFASVGIILCQGGIYAFSVFSTPLAKANNWSVPEVMIAFTICISLSPIPMLIGGKISDKGKSRELILFSSVLLAISFMLTGFATELWQLYLFYGILGTCGLNFGYIACINNCIRFFPDKKGLCSGIVITGIGLGTTVFAPISTWLIGQYSVKTTFIILGAVYLIISLVCVAIIRNAPLEPATKLVKETVSKNEQDYSWKEMLKTPIFYVIVLMYAIGGFSGIMVSGNAADIGVNMFQLTPMLAATYVSMYAISNCLGRVFWGHISDKTSSSNTMLMIYGMIGVSLFCIIGVHSAFGLAVGLIGLGLCEGGVAAVMPPITIEAFGSKNQGLNYGFVFAGYSIAALVAPTLAANIGEKNNGDYTGIFLIGIGLIVAGCLLLFLYKNLQKKRVQEGDLHGKDYGYLED